MSETSAAAAAFCADLVRDQDFARYAATLFVPADQRRALLALYAFNAEIVRIRYQVNQPLPGEIRMQWWLDMLAGHDHGDVQGNPVASELMRAVRSFDLSTDRLSSLVEAHQFDLYNDPMSDMEALETYASATSVTLFALGARIAGGQGDGIEQLARKAGFAQEFLRVMSALPHDAARHQLFMPLQLLEQHGSGRDDVFAAKTTPQLKAACDQLVGEALTHFKLMHPLLVRTPRHVRRIFLPLVLVSRSLQLMRREDYELFAVHAPSRLRILWDLWRFSRSATMRRE